MHDVYAQQDAASAAWTAAQKLLGIGRPLTVQQELACALRILARAGWQENVSGHITWAQEGTDNLWCNPWGIWWEETKASDIVLVSPDGEVIDGKWGATGAVFIHTELHRARPDATVVVHGHPYYVTLLASLGITPPIIHQNSCIFDGDIAFVDEYDGFVSNADAGVFLAEQVGTATGGAARQPRRPSSPGAPSARPATTRSRSSGCAGSRTTRWRWASSRARSRPPCAASMKPGLKLGCPPTFWDGAVRQLLVTEPEVLD